MRRGSTHIEVVGARQNNLRDVSVRIPKHAVTVFTGVSGSGKSSLAFGTIAAEAQRRLDETYSTFVRNRLPRHGRPDADRIAHLSPAIVVDQRRLGGNVRSTVATATDLSAPLRLLFSRLSDPHVGEARAFSFNDPAGMCPRCAGIGTVVEVDLDAAVDRSRSLAGGALRLPGFAPGRWMWRQYGESGLFDLDEPLSRYTDDQWRVLLYGVGGERGGEPPAGAVVPDGYEGAIERFERIYLHQDAGSMGEAKQARLARFTTATTCPLCRGGRLSQAALAARVAGRTITEMAATEVADLAEVLAGLPAAEVGAARPVVDELVAGLRRLDTLGLGYLSLDRPTTTLSGGESQRVKMVRHLGSSLEDMLYVFDEPSVGLHPRDVGRLTAMLRELRDAGNTVLVVEHDRDVIEAADHVVDLGPGAGTHGGHVTFAGTVAGLARSSTPTGRHLRARSPLTSAGRRPTGWLRVEGADLHNLRDVTVDVPTGVLTVVTGVAGSGKSTLVEGVLVPQHPGAVVVDQSALRGSSRSTPATAGGVMDDLRRLFARANGVGAALFSANSAGACPECRGLGVVAMDLAFFDTVRTTCEACGGRRYTDAVLAHTLDGRSIADVLDMDVEGALAWLRGWEPPAGLRSPADRAARGRVVDRLADLERVGLGYLTLGRPLTTLSGGELQRLKLAGELASTGSLYVMDEPTTGLHMADVAVLLGVIDLLVDAGNTVVVVEHDLDVVKHADWVVDLGPEGGSGGGRVVFTGTPADLARTPGSITGRHLAASLPSAAV